MNQQSLASVLLYNLFLIYNNGFSKQWTQLLIYVFKAVTFPLGTFLAAFQKFLYVVLSLSFSLKYFLISLVIFFFDLGYLEMCLIFRYLEISQISIVAFWFNFIVDGEHTLNNFNPLTIMETSFKANHMVYLKNVPHVFEIMYFAAFG